ncbi:polyketide synthase [Actinokineospora sp. PR83]|uniref:polyketide synthase n=1 Tax=Actinokineospora sp. PR83 TaxID=2884908 RepID=UPI0027DF7AE9|nr:polyketide synthase [Actinokineospora sp. PR83]MCG8915257.1 polyketide synthase [Actinokineospora sp. PR83]
MGAVTGPVVQVRAASPGVVLVTMRDEVHKNAFTPELVDGLTRAFAGVRADGDCRAVVLTGYGTYFASGGTREGLIAIHEGRSRFTDLNLYSLALECDVPVISAVQGHAIGGGFALGLYADLVLLSRESVYTANFMRYGFTPGMGATLVLPAKLGPALGHEMLLNASNFRGAELAARGVPFPVLPRAEVLPRALELAAELAEKPAVSLRALKEHLARPLREALPGVLRQELAMHELTFHRTEVGQRVEELFGR